MPIDVEGKIREAADKEAADKAAADKVAADAAGGKDERIENLSKQVEQLTNVVTMLFADDGKDDKDDVKKSSDDKTITDEDIEKMSKKDLVNLILNKVQESLKPVFEGIASSSQNVQINEVKKEIARLQDVYDDYMNYRVEMIEISKKHPSLGAEDVYLLAKTQKTGSAERKKELSTKELLRNIHKPTSLSDRIKEKKAPSSAKEAGELAWELTMGDKEGA